MFFRMIMDELDIFAGWSVVDILLTYLVLIFDLCIAHFYFPLYTDSVDLSSANISSIGTPK